ncbi:NAD-dependent epimerase/dehydratase family protein [Granulicella sp. dw_53]|uniref:NAD-dependent epimerase/dehydratase family protein n=1 Tax=Granulicella sp. dw_53 TaxID=2719792 RepID=UPI001BD318B8|nr:NAD-dependent epimerase/dehydratase family protein [Granulicella sp. dw_53]
MVNGITGHLGYAIAKLLKIKGYEVRGTMRRLSRLSNFPHLQKLGIEIVEADNLDQVSMERALSGMEGFFQVAAVFDMTAKDPVKSVVDPNLLGTERALHAAAAAGVKRVVYTSSITAVGTTRPGQSPKDEDDWNLNAVEPYTRSKALSERRAWELAEELHLNLVSVLPGNMLGPDFAEPTPNIDFIVNALNGKIPVALPMSLSYVDVRDAADAHIRVYEHREASGRYIATGETWSFSKMLGEIKRLRPKAKTSDKVVPIAFARLMPFFDATLHRITGAPRVITSATIKEYLGMKQLFASKRLQEGMGWQARPIQESLADTLEWIDQIALKTPNG